MTRREILKNMYKVVVAVGASSFLSFDDLLAMDRGEITKPNLVWLHGTSCSGCSTSFLNIEGVSVVDILTEYTNVIFHPDISLATGHQVTDLLERANEYKDSIFILEGSIPIAMPHACMMGDKPMTYWVEKLAKNASVCIAAGTCASFGGITDMDGMITGPKTLADFISYKGINKPVINLPNCPMKPEQLLYVLFYYLKTKSLPELDKEKRPIRFFSKTIHERCTRHDYFTRKKFAKKIGDEGCLYYLGCQGIVTKNDCPINGHNDNTNICIKAGHPCIGCADKYFPRKIMLHTYDDKRPNERFKIIS